jgi:GPH family glycoside/pentoside/hexuronide:cation symporter
VTGQPRLDGRSVALPLSNKLLYASGSLGANITFQTLAIWLVYFYAPPDDADNAALVSIGLVGLVLVIGRIIEAVDDPFIGYWSDVTRTRWGRRLPFIVLGTPVLALTFFLLWTPPIDHESAWNALYLFVVLEAFFLANTLVGGPYDALLPEIAASSQDRVSLSAWKVVFGAVGAGIVFMLGGPLIAVWGFAGMGLFLAAITLVSRYLPVLGVRGHIVRESPPSRFRFGEAVRETFTNGQFLAFVPAFVLFTAAQVMLTQWLPFYVDVVLRETTVHLPFDVTLEKTEAKVTLLTAVFFLPLMASVPVMSLLAQRTSKRSVYGLAMLLCGLYFPLLFFLGFLPGIPKLAQSFFVLGLGIPIAGLFVFPQALLADIIDYDEQRTGERREAVYYGVQATLQKVGLGLAAAIFALTLALFGKSADDPLGIRLIGPVAGMCALAGYAVFARGYRLTDEGHLIGQADDKSATSGEE